MTNREAYEESAGIALEYSFFWLNVIDPDAEYIEEVRDDPAITIV